MVCQDSSYSHSRLRQSAGANGTPAPRERAPVLPRVPIDLRLHALEPFAGPAGMDQEHRQATPPPPTAAPAQGGGGRGRSLLLAYLLWLVLGPFGAHRFYLGRYLTGILLFALTLFCAALTLFTVGTLIFSFIVPLLWLVIDALLMPRLARPRRARGSPSSG